MWQVEQPRPETADAGYYEKRALQEDAAVRNAKSKVARQRHEELAMMYRFRASAARGVWQLPATEATANPQVEDSEEVQSGIWL